MEQVGYCNTYRAPENELEATISRFFSLTEYPDTHPISFPEAMELTVLDVNMPTTQKLYTLDARIKFLKRHFKTVDDSQPMTEQESAWYQEFKHYKARIPDYFEHGIPENFRISRDEEAAPLAGWEYTGSLSCRLLLETAERDGVRSSFLLPDMEAEGEHGRYPNGFFFVVPEVAMILIESYSDSEVSWWRDSGVDDLDRILNHIINPGHTPKTYEGLLTRFFAYNTKHTSAAQVYWESWRTGSLAMNQNYDKIESVQELYPEELRYGVGEALRMQIADFAIASARFGDPAVYALPYFQDEDGNEKLVYYEEHYSIVEEGLREMQELFGFWTLVAHLRNNGDLRAIKDPRHSLEDNGSVTYNLYDMGGRLPEGGHVYLRPYGSRTYDPSFEFGSPQSGVAATINNRAPVTDSARGWTLPFSLRAERDGRPKPRQLARTYRRTDAAPDPGFQEGDTTAEIGSVSHDYGSIADSFISPKLVAAGSVTRVDAEGLRLPDFHHGRHFFEDHLGRAGVFADLVLRTDKTLSDLAPSYSESRQLRASGVLK